MPPRKTTRTSRNYRTTNRTNRTTGTNRTNRTTRTPSATYPCNSPKYSPAKSECQWRMGSYRNVYSQFSGGRTKTRFSPTTANKWVKYVNSGNRIYKFNNVEFTRHFGTQWNTNSVTAARQFLRRKFGVAVKDVTRGKGNCWLIATTKNMTGRPFNNYNWK